MPTSRGVSATRVSPRTTTMRARSITRAVDLHLVERLAGRRAPAEHAHAREQLARRERLGHVVVGALHQAADLVVLRAARRQHQDRHAGPRRAQPAADLHAVEPRQHQIEHDEVERLAQPGLDARDAVADRGDLVAVARSRSTMPVAQAGFVFDHEDAHASMVHARPV